MNLPYLLAMYIMVHEPPKHEATHTCREESYLEVRSRYVTSTTNNHPHVIRGDMADKYRESRRKTSPLPLLKSALVMLLLRY